MRVASMLMRMQQRQFVVQTASRFFAHCEFSPWRIADSPENLLLRITPPSLIRPSFVAMQNVVAMIVDKPTCKNHVTMTRYFFHTHQATTAHNRADRHQ